MGANHRPKDLSDLRKWAADLLVICLNCNRRAVFELLPIFAHSRGQGWSTVWGNFGDRFRCRGCEGRDWATYIAPKAKLPPPSPEKSGLQLQQKARRRRH